jgi:phosphatidylinositol alpha-mannosyltransferase
VRVGIYCPYSLGEPGGVREHVLGLCREIKRKGIEVKVLAPNTKKKLKGKDFIYLGTSLKTPTLTGSWGRMGAAFGEKRGEIKEVFKKERFDFLHLHEISVPLLHWQLINAFEGPIVATFHCVFDRNSVAGQVFISTERILRWFHGEKIKGVIAVSQPAKKTRWEFFGPDRLHTVIPNGIDLKRFKKRRKRSDREMRILYVGRIEKRKGLTYLLKAFKELAKEFPNLRLWVVGSGPLVLKDKLFVKEKGLSKKVKFFGTVSGQKLIRIYSQVDIFCSPAWANESFGIILLEAMATGLPIVAFANEGYKEVMKDYPWKKALVKPKSIGGLVVSLQELIKDGELRERLGDWGLEEVKQYDWQVIAGKILDFYKKVLGRPRQTGLDQV